MASDWTICIRSAALLIALPIGWGAAQATPEEGMAVDITDRSCPGCVDQPVLKSPRVLDKPSGNLWTYPFFPQAGRLWGDLFISNFTDRIAGTGFGDFELGTATYDGHHGIDCNLLFWEQQDLGFPIFAALDGVVVSAHDGENDRNTVWNNQAANYVILDHGNGHQTWYWHLRKNGVSVSAGQQVTAGTQLGMTGSSGVSTAPHLHFETRHAGAAHEPFAGPGRAGESLWQDQPPNPAETYVREVIVSSTSLSTWPGLPEPIPRTGTIIASASSQSIYIWWYLINRPTDSNYVLRIRKPDGTLASSTTGTPLAAARRSYIWRSRNLVFNDIGTWTIELEVDGVVRFTGPLEVVASAGQVANRPPVPAAFQFLKDPLTENDVPVCETSTFELVDDPDYDFVSYHYVWRVNGNIVRDVTTGAKSDALSRGLIHRGDVISCDATPTDGMLDAPTAHVETTVSETFNEWCARLGTGSAPDLDSDHDGLTLAQEYALGLSPSSHDNLPAPQATVLPAVWNLPSAAAVPLAEVDAEFSTDLETWLPALHAGGTWTAPVSSPLGFFRLGTTPAPDPVYHIAPADLGPATP